MKDRRVLRVCAPRALSFGLRRFHAALFFSLLTLPNTMSPSKRRNQSGVKAPQSKELFQVNRHFLRSSQFDHRHFRFYAAS